MPRFILFPTALAIEIYVPEAGSYDGVAEKIAASSSAWLEQLTTFTSEGEMVFALEDQQGGYPDSRLYLIPTDQDKRYVLYDVKILEFYFLDTDPRPHDSAFVADKVLAVSRRLTEVLGPVSQEQGWGFSLEELHPYPAIDGSQVTQQSIQGIRAIIAPPLYNEA